MKNNSFSKIALVAIFAVLFATTLSAQVDEPELKSVKDTIEFINYVGPHAKIDSLASIKELGASLGRVITRTKNQYATAGNINKYYVVHAVDPNEKGKLDADILYVGKDATVDHINNLRNIIAAYLSSAYNYSAQDANAIAVFVTVYNAVYRNNMTYFGSKYKNIVMKNLSAENSGLAIRYDQWPGKSQIVIPLYDINGGLSTIDTTTISDKQVVESMQKDEDKNIDPRKDMVDIKEREAANETKKAQDAQQRATEQQNKLAEEKAKLAEEQKKNEQAQKEAEQARAIAEQNKDDKQAQKVADEKEKQAQEQQAKTDEQQAKADETEKAMQDAKDEAEKAQELADRKTTEAQEERAQIAKDQQEIIERNIANARAGAVYGLQLTGEELLSGIVKVNADTAEIIHASPVTSVRNRIFFETGTGFLAIAGKNTGNGAVKLVLLDVTNMEIMKESNEIVAENSVLVQDGTYYYCIAKEGSSWVLAKYDAELKLQSKSKVPLMSNSPISIGDKAIVVTSSNGKIILLSKDKLTEIKNTAKTANAK